MSWESFDVVRFDLEPLQGHTRAAELKSDYNLLIIGPRGCNVKPTHRKSWAGNLLMWSDLTLSPSFKVKWGQLNLKVIITRLLLVLEVCNVKPTYRKSWAGNLLMWSDLTLSPSFKVKRGQPNLKVLITYLLLILQVCNVKPTYRKSCAGHLLMWSDLTLGPFFKVKRWFTDFGELSFRWIQISIGSPMRGSSYNILVNNQSLLCGRQSCVSPGEDQWWRVEPSAGYCGGCGKYVYLCETRRRWRHQAGVLLPL